MSFSFGAIGTKDEVVAQLKQAAITGSGDRFNDFGRELRDLLVTHLQAETVDAGPGHEYRYTVKAWGHGGGTSPLTLNAEIEAHWLPVPAKAVNEGAVDSGDSIASD